jgi:hypothetical protein
MNDSTIVVALSQNFGILAKHATSHAGDVRRANRTVHFALEAQTVLRITKLRTPTMNPEKIIAA